MRYYFLDEFSKWGTQSDPNRNKTTRLQMYDLQKVITALEVQVFVAQW